MAILDIFSARSGSAFGGKKTAAAGKEKPAKKAVRKNVKRKKKEKTVKTEAAETKEEGLNEAVSKRPEGKNLLKKDFSYAAYKVLKSPHVTEKAVSLGAQNKYVFKIRPDANGAEARKAIQELYGVKVENVNIIKIPRKKRKVGRSEGFKPGYKKIIVTLREGEKIETGV